MNKDTSLVTLHDPRTGSGILGPEDLHQPKPTIQIKSMPGGNDRSGDTAQNIAQIATENQGQRDVAFYVGLYIALVLAAMLDALEVVELAADASVVVGLILRWLTLIIEGLFFIGFQYLCWKEKVPLAERRAVNAVRVVATIFPALELMANFIGLPVITWLEVLPAKTGAVFALFFLRPLAKRFVHLTTQH